MYSFGFRSLLSAGLAALVFVAGARAEDAYYQVPIRELKLTEGKLPEGKESNSTWRRWQVAQFYDPYARVEGGGEVYFASNGDVRVAAQINQFDNVSLVVRTQAGKDVAGICVFPTADLKSMTKVRFKIDASQAKPEAKAAFLNAKERRLQELLARNLPGGAWFRHELRETIVQRTGKVPTPTPDRNLGRGRPGGFHGELDQDTFDLFTGGRAVSENLQLDRILTPAVATDKMVDVSSIEGITVAEIDWKQHMLPGEPQLDALANCIPADQHALIFRSFDAMIRTFDEADAQVTPLLRAAEPHAQDARSAERYKTQLCLEDSAIARAMGPQVISSVAITGSDPYLPTGTDVAILFETNQPTVLLSFLTAKQAAAKQKDANIQSTSAESNGVRYTGVRSADRSICSYVAELGNVVVVSNSTAQLERVIQAHAKKTPTLASLPEYRFFRQRYQRTNSEETGFLILTDAAIRRWCGPRWRIGSSRRTRAAAAMTELQAAHLKELANGKVEAGPLHTDLNVPEMGNLRLSPNGVESSTFGTLAFMTPIAELQLDRVTEGEAKSYETWRRNYQSYWRNAFDPIAVQFGVSKERLSADVTVMPLIAGTDYREFLDITKDVALPPDGCDRHADSLLHFAMALNTQSSQFKQINNFLSQPMAGLRFEPLSWVGKSISIWLDDDPIWKEVAASPDPDKFLQKQFNRLPLVLRIECADSLKMTLFLTALRAFIDQTAPGMTRWNAVQYNGQGYVKIEPARRGEMGLPGDFYICYATTPEALLFSLNESTLKKSLDRITAAAKAKQEGKPVPATKGGWIGESLALEISPGALAAARTAFSNSYQTAMQASAWSNLAILNEWKRLFPEQDSRALHARLWNVRLVCPGNGEYVWNDEFQTYASSVYGHPGQPKNGPLSPPAFANAAGIRLGLTFEKDGLRARAMLERKP